MTREDRSPVVSTSSTDGGAAYCARTLSRLRGLMFARLMSPPKWASTLGSITRRQTAGTMASTIIPAYPVGSTGLSSKSRRDW